MFLRRDLPLFEPDCHCLDSRPDIGVWTEGDAFFRHLTSTYERVDAITYTTGASTSLRLRRLIIGANETGRSAPPVPRPELGYKVYHHLHTKLYLGWNGVVHTAYVGSHNLSSPKDGELMIRACPRQSDFLLEYFNHLWTDKNKIYDTK